MPPSEDPVPPDDWASEICTATSDWFDELVALADDFQENPDLSSGVAAKGSVLGFLDDVRGDRRHDAEVDAAGILTSRMGMRPPIRMRAAWREVRATIEDARSRIEALPTDDQKALMNGIDAVGKDLQESGDAIAVAFVDIGSSEMNAILNSSSACQQLPAA